MVEREQTSSRSGLRDAGNPTLLMLQLVVAENSIVNSGVDSDHIEMRIGKLQVAGVVLGYCKRRQHVLVLIGVVRWSLIAEYLKTTVEILVEDDFLPGVIRYSRSQIFREHNVVVVAVVDFLHALYVNYFCLVLEPVEPEILLSVKNESLISVLVEDINVLVGMFLSAGCAVVIITKVKNLWVSHEIAIRTKSS